MLYLLQKLVTNTCAGKKAYCTILGAGKEAYSTIPCARKEAYCSIPWAGKGYSPVCMNLEAGRGVEQGYCAIGVSRAQPAIMCAAAYCD